MRLRVPVMDGRLHLSPALMAIHSAAVVWAFDYSALVASSVKRDNLTLLPALGLVCDWLGLYDMPPL